MTVLKSKAFGNSTVLRFAEVVKVFRSVCHSPDSGVKIFEASGRRVNSITLILSRFAMEPVAVIGGDSDSDSDSDSHSSRGRALPFFF